MQYWFASIKSPNINKNHFTSLEKAENYQQEHGGTIEKVPVYESEEAVEDWIQEQDNPSLYSVKNFSESFQSAKRQPYEEHTITKSGNNIEIPQQIYFVV